MTYYAGLDVSLEETAICVVDADGTIVREVRAESAPDALHHALKRLDLPLERVGMEACSLTAWLHDGLTAAGWPAICIETRRAASWGCGAPTAPQGAAMKTMPNKTDRNDARACCGVRGPRSPARWRRSCGRAGFVRCTSRAGKSTTGARFWSPGGRFSITCAAPWSAGRTWFAGSPARTARARHAQPQGFRDKSAGDGRQRTRAHGNAGAAFGRAGVDDERARQADQAGPRHREARGDLPAADDHALRGLLAASLPGIGSKASWPSMASARSTRSPTAPPSTNRSGSQDRATSVRIWA